MKSNSRWEVSSVLKNNCKVNDITEVPSTPQTFKALWLKGTSAIVGDLMASDLKENALSKNGSIKVRSFPRSTPVMLLYLIRTIRSHMPENHLTQRMKHPNIIFRDRPIYKVPCKRCKSLQFHRGIQHIYRSVFHISNYSSMSFRKENNCSLCNAIRS